MTYENDDGARGPEPTIVQPEERAPRPGKRPWKSRLIELALWALLSIVTAVVMVLLSNKLLPTNF